MTRPIRVLAGVWFVLAALAAWVTASSARERAIATPPRLVPQQVYGDACASTCPPIELCEWTRRVGEYWFDCCVFDWGCLLNPGEPRFQIKPCKRRVGECRLPQPIEPEPPQVAVDSRGSRLNPQMLNTITCCDEKSNCREVDGNPCCHPLDNVRCP